MYVLLAACLIVNSQKHITGVVSIIASVYKTREVEENVTSGRAASGSRGH